MPLRDEPPPVTIEISDSQDHLRIDHSTLRDLATRVLQGEGVVEASISIALVDDAAIHAINRRHLDHDWPTDVITFRLSDAPHLEAELVVSAEMAVATSREAGTDASAELVLYMVHGLLHLCGYDDHTVEDVTAMRGREDAVLRREGWENTFSSVKHGTEVEPCPA